MSGPTTPENAGAGVALAQAILRALAHDDDAQVLALLNSSTPEVNLWTSATLAQMVRHAMVAALSDPADARAAMLEAADAMTSDIALTQVEVIVHDQLGGAA